MSSKNCIGGLIYILGGLCPLGPPLNSPVLTSTILVTLFFYFDLHTNQKILRKNQNNLHAFQDTKMYKHIIQLDKLHKFEVILVLIHRNKIETSQKLLEVACN